MKVIDLGSSFLLNSQEIKLKDQIEFGQSTPEYLPPEVLFYLEQLQRLKLNVPNLTEL
jgi:hypothetical protein